MSYLRLINELIKRGYLKTPRIVEAFRRIDRIDFVPERLKGEAYANAPLPIGFGQTISQPLTVAFMLELLNPEKGNKILDIGSGSGWQTALLADAVGQEGKIFAMELIPELKELGEKNVRKYNFLGKGIVDFICADGSKGLAEKAPFDRIIVAAAGKAIPPALKEQLKLGGRLVIPVSGSIWLVIKRGIDDFEEKEFPGFVFVPLITK